jgi:hypothetical protein
MNRNIQSIISREVQLQGQMGDDDGKRFRQDDQEPQILAKQRYVASLFSWDSITIKK